MCFVGCYCSPGAVTPRTLRAAAQNCLEGDDDEAFVPTREDAVSSQKRRSDLRRIREQQESVFMSQEFDFCWSCTLGIKLRTTGGVSNVHAYVLPPCVAGCTPRVEVF